MSGELPTFIYWFGFESGRCSCLDRTRCTFSTVGLIFCLCCSDTGVGKKWSPPGGSFETLGKRCPFADYLSVDNRVCSKAIVFIVQQ